MAKQAEDPPTVGGMVQALAPTVGGQPEENLLNFSSLKWAKVEMGFVRWAGHHNLSSRAWTVLVTLLSYAVRPIVPVFPSTKSIAERAGIPLRTVEKGVRELRKAFEAHGIGPFCKRRSVPGGYSNIYALDQLYGIAVLMNPELWPKVKEKRRPPSPKDMLLSS